MSRQRRPTSAEVARLAGVSRSTVSFVLNNVDDISISEATRRRVLAAARELGYVPSAAARTLASGMSRTVGLVICHAEHIKVDAFIPQALYSLNEVCHGEGYRVLVETVEDVSQPDAYHQWVRAKQIDGLVVLNPRSDDHQLPRFIEEGFPIVVIGRIDHPDATWVDVDNRSAARSATEHLIEQGCRRIAHVAYGPETYESVRSRRNGYREALEGAGIDDDPARVAFANFSAASGYATLRAMLERERPDAVFFGNDTVAIGGLRALHEHGYDVPRDVRVVGFDDIPVAEFATPPLSTVRMPAVDMGRRAGRLLIDIIQGRRPSSPHAVLDAELILRESSCLDPSSR